jgi:hypothetical protein
MGWVDWLLRPFRARPAETEGAAEQQAPAPAPQEAPEPKREEAKAEPRPKVKAKAKAKAEGAEGEPRKKKKARKYGTTQPPTPPAPRAEVLPIAEAERRAALATPAPIPPVAVPPAAVPPVPAAPGQAEAATAESAPAQAPRRADPALEEARRAEAAENRRRARLPRFHALLSRTDALLAVAEAEPRHLASARRELVEGWAELGSPPREALEELDAARDARLAMLDDRLRVASEATEAQQKELAAQRWAIVEEARALAEREDLKGAGPAMGELRARLRAVGKVGADDPAVKAFGEAEVRLKQRQEQLRSDRDAARTEQLQKLEQLVQRAEALAASADPETAAERVKALQATWKTVRVPGPRAEVDAAWARFRAACDAVFAARTAAREVAGRAALERLEAIVLQVEATAENGPEGDPEDEIHRALTAWKKVGRAPREPQQALWERMQRAFDRIRSPQFDWDPQEAASLQFRPFAGLARDEDSH